MDKGSFSSIDIEQQEHLSLKKLQQFKTNNIDDLPERPKEYLIDLMTWTEDSFKSFLKDQIGLNRFIHNRIIMDGQFLRFCEENKMTIECLHKNSVVSWKTDHHFEKFFMQGVFLIKGHGWEFLQASLMHKGNQFEDEVGFFVIVSEKNYEAYINVRNQFDAWVQRRDRNNLRVRVIDGEDIIYTKDHTWDDLFLPASLKNEIKSLVENFLSSKEFYLKNKIPWKRGILLYGEPGNGKTSLIRTIMSVYNFKPITITTNANDEVIREAFTYAEEQSPSLLYFEDLDSLLEKRIDSSSFLNLMDGISARNGILVVATANDVRSLKSNITDRPSRFDRKFEIPPPNQEMAGIYLKRWFNDLLSAKKVKELAKYAERYEFSYAYLKEFYLSTMFEALAHNRKTPIKKDIDHALQRLIKDKNILHGRIIDTDKYFKSKG